MAVVAAALLGVGIGAAIVATRGPGTSAANTGTPTPPPAAVTSSSTEAPSAGGSPTPASTVAPASAATATATPTPSVATSAALATGVTVTSYGFDATADAARVAGYVDVIEQGGTCTLTMTMGDRSATQSVAALADATTTSCGTLEIPRGKLGTGAWLAVLSYRSTDRAGSAPAVTIEVP